MCISELTHESRARVAQAAEVEHGASLAPFCPLRSRLVPLLAPTLFAAIVYRAALHWLRPCTAAQASWMELAGLVMSGELAEHALVRRAGTEGATAAHEVGALIDVRCAARARRAPGRGLGAIPRGKRCSCSTAALGSEALEADEEDAEEVAGMMQEALVALEDEARRPPPPAHARVLPQCVLVHVASRHTKARVFAGKGGGGSGGTRRRLGAAAGTVDRVW